ncbi:chromosome segregation protein SMC [Corynebacterium crudilactis]|uniref:Chromosome partition protein Smc n=1 Tax=Corynebacterium crudilactis TaxID=1652495 RepID=A0A172QUE6_9CORY|nr:chromosome segregation protein SMC [Corynebacterium crudilactis]ANE04327.1 chromosome segregation protein SMC [Corynebacterium crudilactis]
MYLKSLTLKGFKSFASATTLKFEPGICAVVGPNGSGKSNVVDALAWVMGEGSAKTLRGGKMEDVIFAGAGDRKPLGRAEVTLTIDNADGALPIEYTEVSVTRRMFRDGASEYEINGSRARLMDIQELLSDSGIGREMHVMVGQGKLAEILESRPEERRAYIEEAAGVLKHRRRKEKAQRKIEGMRVNLDRLQDLTHELAKQLKPLARQAETAQRAATVQADLRDARFQLAGFEIVQLSEKLDTSTEREKMIREQVDAAQAQVEEATTTQMEVELQLSEVTPQAEAAQQLWFDLSSLAERVSATIRIAADRASTGTADVAYAGQDPDELLRRAELADQELAELDASVAMTAERLNSVQEQAEEKATRARVAEQEHVAQVRAISDRREGVVRLLASEESLRTQHTAAEEEAGRLGEQLEEFIGRILDVERERRLALERKQGIDADRRPVEEALEQAAHEAHAAEMRLEQLRAHRSELEKEVSRLQSRIETLNQNRPRSEASDVVKYPQLATLIRPQRNVDKALAAALGPHAEALAGEAAEGLVDKLIDAGVARTIIVDDQQTSSGAWRLDASMPAGASWLLDHVDLDPAIAGPVNRLLADVLLVDEPSIGRQAVQDDPRLRAVDRDGVLIGAGWIQIGTHTSTVEISAHIEEAETQLTATSAKLDDIAGTFDGAKKATENTRVDVATRTAALRELDMTTDLIDRDLNRLDKQHEAAEAERVRHVERFRAAEQRTEELREQLTEIVDRLSRVDNEEEADEPSTTVRDQANAELQHIRAMEMDARLALRTAEERAGQQRGKGDSLRRQAAAELQAKIRHDQALEARRRRTHLAAAIRTGAQAVSERVAVALSQAAAERDQRNQEKAVLVTQAAQAKDTVNAVRQQLNRLNDNAHSMEIARSQAQVRMEAAVAKITEQLGIPVTELLHDYSPTEGFDEKFQRARLKQAEKDLAALGKVNPLALEEFKALEERYEFLSTQLADVEQARADLSGVIDDVDAKILQLFTDAWKDVEAEFPRVFSTLFPGGEGKLVLTEPDDLLATGIEVEARPPGKRVKRLSLLSGGEKSLTALAMLVAIFRARPSPFYVMDEVEAALDDVNLRRLIALFEELRQDSQLIVITHQKPTMDVANVLYGVTMRDDGVTRVISQRMEPASVG